MSRLSISSSSGNLPFQIDPRTGKPLRLSQGPQFPVFDQGNDVAGRGPVSPPMPGFPGGFPSGFVPPSSFTHPSMRRPDPITIPRFRAGGVGSASPEQSTANRLAGLGLGGVDFRDFSPKDINGALDAFKTFQDTGSFDFSSLGQGQAGTFAGVIDVLGVNDPKMGGIKTGQDLKNFNDLRKNFSQGASDSIDRSRVDQGITSGNIDPFALSRIATPTQRTQLFQAGPGRNNSPYLRNINKEPQSSLPQSSLTQHRIQRPKKQNSGGGELGQQFLNSQNSRNIPGFSKGGKLRKNQIALVGEKGPELIRKKGDEVNVLSNEDLVNSILASFGGIGKTTTTKGKKVPLVTKTSKKTGVGIGNTPSIGRNPSGSEVLASQFIPGKTTTSRGDAQTLAGFIAGDLARQQQALDEQKANEQQALGIRGEAIQAAQGVRGTNADLFNQLRSDVTQGVSDRQEAVQAAEGRGTKGLKQASNRVGQTVKQGQRQLNRAGSVARTTANTSAAQVVEAADQASQQALAIYQEQTARASQLKEQDAASFRDTTAQAITVSRQALDQAHQSRLQQLGAQARNPEELRALQSQETSRYLAGLGMMSAQIQTTYNKDLADINSRGSDRIIQTGITLGSSVNRVNIARGQLTAAAGQLRVSGAQANIEAAKTSAALGLQGEAIRSQLQRATADLTTQLNAQANDIWKFGQQVGAASFQAQAQLDLAATQAETAQMGLLATDLRGLSTNFVQMSPAYSALMELAARLDNENRVNRELELGASSGTIINRR